MGLIILPPFPRPLSETHSALGRTGKCISSHDGFQGSGAPTITLEPSLFSSTGISCRKAAPTRCQNGQQQLQAGILNPTERGFFLMFS